MTWESTYEHPLMVKVQICLWCSASIEHVQSYLSLWTQGSRFDKRRSIIIISIDARSLVPKEIRYRMFGCCKSFALQVKHIWQILDSPFCWFFLFPPTCILEHLFPTFSIWYNCYLELISNFKAVQNYSTLMNKVRLKVQNLNGFVMPRSHSCWILRQGSVFCFIDWNPVQADFFD